MTKPEMRWEIVNMVQDWRTSDRNILVMAHLLSCAELSADGYSQAAELAAKKLFKLIN